MDHRRWHGQPCDRSCSGARGHLRGTQLTSDGAAADAVPPGIISSDTTHTALAAARPCATVAGPQAHATRR
eukprot:6078755-Pyramimonas_sp.AAC.1